MPELNKCYLETTRYATREPAEDYCRSFTGRLPDINTVAEQELVACALESHASPLSFPPLPSRPSLSLVSLRAARLRLPSGSYNWLPFTRKNASSPWMDDFWVVVRACACTRHRAPSRALAFCELPTSMPPPRTLQNFFNWAEGEPSAKEGLNCALLFFDPTSLAHGHWFARNCSEPHHILCKDIGTARHSSPSDASLC